MKSIKECLGMTDIAELKQEVIIRRKLMSELVGQLYPSIVANEIILINRRIELIWRRIRK